MIDAILYDSSGRPLTAEEKGELEAGLKAFSVGQQRQHLESPRYAGRELDDVEAVLRFKHLCKAPAQTWTSDDRKFVESELQRLARARQI